MKGILIDPRSASKIDPLSLTGRRRQRSPRRSWSGLRSRGRARVSEEWLFGGAGAVLEAPALFAGFDDVALMGVNRHGVQEGPFRGALGMTARSAGFARVNLGRSRAAERLPGVQ